MKKIRETIIEGPNLTAVLKPEHVGKWVALSSNYKKLLAVGDTLDAVLKAVRNFPDKTVMKVLPNLGYAPNAD
jgi:hypothetical protein